MSLLQRGLELTQASLDAKPRQAPRALKGVDLPAIGDTFGQWTVVSEPFMRRFKTYSAAAVEVECSCKRKTRTKVIINHLKVGQTTKCRYCNYAISSNRLNSLYGGDQA